MEITVLDPRHLDAGPLFLRLVELDDQLMIFRGHFGPGG